jgi:transmembrane sensor
MSCAASEHARNTPAVPDEMIEEAIHWTLKVRFNTPSDDTRRAFEKWLGSDPRRKEAWRQMQAAQEGFDTLPGPQALNIFKKVEEKRRSRGISRRSAIKLALLGGVLLMAGRGYQLLHKAPRETTTAVTNTGGRRTLRLSEGTVIELNTDTALRTDFTASARYVHLLKGEVLITTGKDADTASRRPFLVETPFGPLEALGTRFSVRLMADAVRIATLEGAVRLGDAEDGAVAEIGETWMLDDRGPRQAGDSARDTAAWVEGVIVARNMPLSDLLAEFSRYRTGEIIWDSRVADLKVSGVYQTRNIDKALSIVSRSLPVVLSGRPGNAIYVSASAHPASPTISAN